MKLGLNLEGSPEIRTDLDIKVGVHLGNVLFFLSQFYGKPLQSPREYTQNSIDAEARKIIVKSDHIKHILEVFDNGKGATYEEIEKKFSRVGMSLKADNPTKIGEKGLGNLAGLAIGNTYELMTKDPEVSDFFRVFTLTRADLQDSDEINLRCKEFPDSQIPGKFPFRPSTMVRISGISESAMRQLADLEEVETTLVNAFADVINNGKVEIVLVYINKKGVRTERKVQALRFRGGKLSKETIATPHGDVVFELYFSPKALKEPRILIDHKKVTSVPLGNLWHRKQLSTPMRDVYLSGHFEGMIHLPFGVLNPDRDAFEFDESLESFINALETYGTHTLRAHIDQIKEEEREARLKRISQEVSERMNSFFKENPLLFPESFRGITSKGRKLHPEEMIIALLKTRKEPPPIPPTPGPKPEGTKPPHLRKPAIPKPKSITPKGSAVPLKYDYPREDEGFNWHSKVEEGLIRINTANTNWIAAEMAGKETDYVATLVQKELTVALLPDELSRHKFNETFENTFMRFWRANL